MFYYLVFCDILFMNKSVQSHEEVDNWTPAEIWIMYFSLFIVKVSNSLVNVT